ncbi:MAG: DUF2071 domain-containing protein [Streptosporangiaceae bacterium]|nr:DUF2071 domain-containing protein [Streptosporangiaceae bacterium]
MTNAQPGGVPAVQPDSDIRVPVLRQAWRTVTFVHWRCDTALLQRRLPAGLTVEEYDGSAWLTLTPLRMHGVRLPGTPAVPGLSDFPETNLRTYVRGPGGRQGLWFFSLDAASAWITAGARLLLGAPYFLAELDIEAGDGIRYTGTRAGRVPAVYRLEIRPGPPVGAVGLHLWLTHRWRAYTWHAGCLLEIPVRHEPWPLRTATAAALMESLTTAAGLPAPAGAPLIHYSDGVERVAFGPARPVRCQAAARRPGINAA